MALDERQKAAVAEWARSGVALADIQRRIASEFGATMTYMEVRFLVDDLKVDLPPPPPPPAEPAAGEVGGNAGGPAKAAKSRGGLFGFGRKQGEDPAEEAGVSVEVDRVMKPGTLVSGSAVFSDGQRAQWYLDEMGRLGVQPEVPGYQPSPEDIRQFQMALQMELRQLGYA